MKKSRYIIHFVILFVITFTIKAQELPVYSQYILNPFLINPSIAGISDGNILQFMNRTQWLGIKDAPQTFLVSYHQNMGKSTGLGGYIYTDKNGYTSNQGIQLSYAYHVYLHKGYAKKYDKMLSFGLSVSAFQRKIEFGNFIAPDDPDPLLESRSHSVFSKSANVGFYYTANNYFAGITFANLIPTTSHYYISKKTYFLQFGKTYSLPHGYKLEPSVTIKINEQKSWQLDGNLKLYFQKIKKTQPWLGLSVRNDMGYSFKKGTYTMWLAGIGINNMRFAYAFEYGINSIRSNNWGTHEFMILYNFHDFKPCDCPAYN